MGWRLVALLIGLVIVVGTAGYMLIEGWSAWDAFYMTAITITTVGFGEVHPLSRAGQAFTVFICFTGVGAIFYAFTLFMSLLAGGALVERWGRHKPPLMPESLHDPFLPFCALPS